MSLYDAVIGSCFGLVACDYNVLQFWNPPPLQNMLVWSLHPSSSCLVLLTPFNSIISNISQRMRKKRDQPNVCVYVALIPESQIMPNQLVVENDWEWLCYTKFHAHHTSFPIRPLNSLKWDAWHSVIVQHLPSTKKIQKRSKKHKRATSAAETVEV